MTTPTDRVRAALEVALRESKAQPGLRQLVKQALSELDGMVLVPVEPTKEMLRTGGDVCLGAGGYYGEYNIYCGNDNADTIYRAMIAPYVEGE